ncbi:hypothetical protein HNQ85_003076 [Anoxybacillus calidus]|uniref:Uncharacterized protein n=1 Tax=[Anoxybacillus] calidus TaxID=575178 RepID=A0A7V9Z2B1_9BACL|nr:hypothetical protein [Anoxybacillus calidus]MBA2872764.1 hypothetical protein [Anoxybacillus calidus]
MAKKGRQNKVSQEVANPTVSSADAEWQKTASIQQNNPKNRKAEAP